MMTRRLCTALLMPLLLLGLVSGCKSGSKAVGTVTSAAGSAAGSVTSAAGSGAGSVTSAASGSSSSAGAATGSTGSSQCPTSNATSFAKTKFLLHTGLAFGAFHRYLYKPFQAGDFKSGAHGRIASFVKAGTSALFIKREVRLASEDVKANPTLCKAIAAPLKTVGDTISGAVTSLKGGNASGITAVQSAVTAAESNASSAGTPIKEDANAPLR